MHTVIVDGREVDPDAPSIRPLDEGLMGHGVYESIRTYDGIPFALAAHLDRLRAGAEALEIVLPREQLAVETSRAAASVVASGATEARIRIVLTTSGTRIVSADPLPDRRAEAEAGIVVVTLPWARQTDGPASGVKATSTAATRIALRWAQQRGAATGLWLTPSGDVAEALTANVFAVIAGTLVTPPLSVGILAGVTRSHLLQWAGEEGIDVSERLFDLDDLRAAEEAFVSATSEPVVPVATLDGMTVGTPGGRLTRHLAELFARRARQLVGGSDSSNAAA